MFFVLKCASEKFFIQNHSLSKNAFVKESERCVVCMCGEKEHCEKEIRVKQANKKLYF